MGIKTLPTRRRRRSMDAFERGRIGMLSRLKLSRIWLFTLL
jgi:hypothetical protein